MQRYIFAAFIHPKTGGDDYLITGWVLSANKTYARKEVRGIIREEGSAVVSDYIMTEGWWR